MRHRTARPRALLALPAALLLAAAGALVPPAMPGLRAPAALVAPVARAATGIDVSSSATYTVDPAAAVVRVRVVLVARNTTPDAVGPGAISRYYYTGVNVGVQLEASNLRATQGGTPVPVRVTARSDWRLVAVSFRAPIYFGESATVALAFELPAGRPRSTSDVRVGRAFASFLAWSFGDTGTVRIEVPSAFSADVTGADMTRSTAGETTVFTASAADAAGWYAWVNARNDAGLTRELLDIPGGETIVVRGWPEDAAWRTRVSSLLVRGVPALAARIGLPWPVSGPLNVLEIHTPLLEGYAGFYNPAKTEITVTEDLDALTIVHEASHAWFNDALFTERWIDEGLADEYAARVLRSIGETVTGLEAARRTDPAAFPLEAWPPPSAIRDNASAAKEQYGYAAAWTVIHAVVDAAGDEGMRRVFRAAHDGTTAYVGSGTPEHSVLPNDWRRFLDLAQELGGAAGTADLLATWALPADEAAQLAPRATARSAYHDLVVASGSRAVPWAVRSALDGWTFDVATARIAEARRVVARLDEMGAIERAVGLGDPRGVWGPYVEATDQAALDGADASTEHARAELDALAAAIRAVGAPRDWLTTVGLLGAQDPVAAVADARQLWESGNGGGAAAGAALASLDGATELGRERVVVVGVAAGGFVVLLLVRRLRRRRRGPGRPDRYATLPASVPPEWAPRLPDEPGSGAVDAEQGAERS